MKLRDLDFKEVVSYHKAEVGQYGMTPRRVRGPRHLGIPITYFLACRTDGTYRAQNDVGLAVFLRSPNEEVRRRLNRRGPPTATAWRPPPTRPAPPRASAT